MDHADVISVAKNCELKSQVKWLAPWDLANVNLVDVTLVNFNLVDVNLIDVNLEDVNLVDVRGKHLRPRIN